MKKIVEIGSGVRGYNDLVNRGVVTPGTIPREVLQRVGIRSDFGSYSPEAIIGRESAKGNNMSTDTVVGWFSNNYSVEGWHFFELNQFDKREFGIGPNIFRSLSFSTSSKYHGGHTNIVKVDPLNGTYAFLDSKAYEQGNIIFERMSKYRTLQLIQDKLHLFNIF